MVMECTCMAAAAYFDLVTASINSTSQLTDSVAPVDCDCAWSMLQTILYTSVATSLLLPLRASVRRVRHRHHPPPSASAHFQVQLLTVCGRHVACSVIPFAYPCVASLSCYRHVCSSCGLVLGIGVDSWVYTYVDVWNRNFPVLPGVISPTPRIDATVYVSTLLLPSLLPSPNPVLLLLETRYPSHNLYSVCSSPRKRSTPHLFLFVV